MNEWLEAAHAVLEPYPWAYTVLALSAVLLAAWLANWITKHVLLRGLRRLLQAVPFAAQSSGVRLQVIPRLANVVPALVVYAGLEIVPGLPEQVVKVVRALCDAFMVLTVALAIGKLLDVLAEVYQQRADNRNRPIKGYMQVVKIVVFALATLSIVATLAGVPFVHLVTGLGAASAVLMLIFQDTILSFVASAQISGDGRVRVGDWIEMPGQNADGDVVDIALHTVTVQNWDKTITTIPTRKLISESFKNWRGMQQSGGRRVKRSLYLDQNSVHFLTPKEHERLSHIALLDDYLKTKRVDITQWNAQLAPDSSETVNQRRLTNLGTFRAYVECYLRSHPGIHQGMTLMVRQLQPTATGLPLEIYCFTNTVVWAQYEAIQSDIFDHLLAILPEFDLNLFQEPSGNDVRTAPMFAAGAL